MKNLFYISLLFVLVTACQPKASQEETQVDKTFEAERSAFFSNLQRPAEVAARLQATAAEFDASLLSDPANASNYAGDQVKAAANLGVYLSDLNYSVAYQQAENTKELFAAAHSLSKSIGIEQGVLEFLMKRYDENLAQNDSVKAIINDLFEESTSDLQGTDREKLVGITMAAYQIENLHLALGVLSTYPKDILPDDARTAILVPLFKMVLEQKQNVETIYGFLLSIADPSDPEKQPNYTYYSTAFQELIDVYNRLNVDEKIANNQGAELLNDAVVQELSEKVNAIRSKVVSI